ncbi:MAG: hypothetical protein AAF721_21505 [Myxococcota bacterium]
MTENPKRLVERLSPVCLAALERTVADAAAQCLTEVVPEHLFQSLLHDDSSGARRLLDILRVDHDAVVAVTQRVVGQVRAGNAGKPVFATALFQWLQDAWSYGSLELQRSHIDSATLCRTWIRHFARYTTVEFRSLSALDKRAVDAHVGTFDDAAAPAPSLAERVAQLERRVTELEQSLAMERGRYH